MTRRPWLISFFLALTAAACIAVPLDSFAGSPKEMRAKASCIEEVRIARATSPLKAWDSQGAGPQRTSVRAADLKGGDYEAVPSLARYAASGRMLMGIDRKTHEPVVSSRYFSPLARVDATTVETGQAKEIGTLLGPSADAPSFRDIVLFLLESQIITTYWHVESIMCLVSEDNSADSYMAHFQGKHIYYTNRYNEEKLDFSLSIEKKTGRMLLHGGG